MIVGEIKISLNEILEEKAVGVIGASYDDDGKDREGNPVDVNQKVEDKFQGEKSLGRPVQHHYILRDSGENADRLKFNMNLMDVPVVAYIMMSILESDGLISVLGKDIHHHAGKKWKKWAIVGNDHTKLIVDKFNEFYKLELEESGKTFIFVHEGSPKEWSLGNTLKKGTDAFKDKDDLEGEDKIVAFLNGDIPLFFDIDSFVNDPDILEYKSVTDLNSREKMFGLDPSKYGYNGYFQRNYHLKESDGLLARIAAFLGFRKNNDEYEKEANMYLFYYKVVKPWIDELYEGRKSASGQNKKVFFKMAFGTLQKKIKSAYTFLTSPAFTLEAITKFVAKDIILRGYVIPKSVYNLPAAAYNQGKIDELNNLLYPLKRKLLPLHWKEHPIMKYNVPRGILQKIASIAFGAPMRIKAEHTDAARLMDIDSWEDWYLVNGMMHKAEDPKEIYPYWNMLKGFAQFQSYFVENGVRMMDPEHLNKQVGLYKNLRGKEPFDSEGNFQFTMGSEERMMEGIADRKAYIANWKQKKKSQDKVNAA